MRAALGIYFLVFFLFSCNNSKKKDNLIVKEIPNIYIEVNTLGLKKTQDIIFLNGKKFDGYIYEMYNVKDTAFIKSYSNGIEEGVHNSWYSNKQLAEKRFYHLGKKVGTHQYWWENGKKQMEYQIANDEYTGEFQEWNRDGQLIKFFHYKNGQEDGSQKLYYDNGSIRSNYVIINGRRYGLLGTKNCKNVKENAAH
jgi:antitoxin component YwqK of YwqJK toxin-antitoxin module